MTPTSWDLMRTIDALLSNVVDDQFEEDLKTIDDGQHVTCHIAAIDIKRAIEASNAVKDEFIAQLRKDMKL